MKRLTGVCTCLMVVAFVLSGIPDGHAQAAEEILNKADAVYSNAKSCQTSFSFQEKDSYQAKTFDHNEAGTVKVKVIGKTKYALHVVYDKSQDLAHKGVRGDWDSYDDGKNHYVYLPSDNWYFKDTHDKGIVFLANNGILDEVMHQLKPKQGVTYTLLAPTKVNGKVAYVIEARSTKEEMFNLPDHSVKKDGQTIHLFYFPKQIQLQIRDRIYIDQATFQFLQRESESSSPERTINIVQKVNSEVLDAPIPDSTFVFKVPKGAKKDTD